MVFGVNKFKRRRRRYLKLSKSVLLHTYAHTAILGHVFMKKVDIIENIKAKNRRPCRQCYVSYSSSVK